ncbi:unnamed protein product [Hydatigera taeniaeformis]|uniref:SANT domain-containing protein n=1 Tax=Hydatigena taeniaeformis TaxID=6205 RepID=A0A0R3WZP7_HYDTA|nr:unnamed protein product [Hydatigera taeniaeformis]
MSAVKRNANGKSAKSSKKLKEVDVSSRVGSSYQVDVPEFVYNRSPSFACERSIREINVWNPEHSPPLSDVDIYLSEAKKHKYPEESARIFLHYHKYNVQQALDDLPNYQPILNTYNKLEVRRFLKCVDSRPRKNFVNVSESFPAYRMGELHALYYAIAAPFKAIPRHNRKHGRQMQVCYERAVKRGFTASSAVPVPVIPSVVDPEEAEADVSFERYLCEMLGQERANKVVASVRRGRSVTDPPTASNATVHVRLPYGGIANGALPFGRRYVAAAAATESLVGSSDHSSALESHSKAAKRSIPPELDFDYGKFREFVTTPVEDLKQKQKESKATLSSLDTELKVRTEVSWAFEPFILCSLSLVDRSQHFANTYTLKFSNVSFRWTKSELALLLMALREYGKDFIKVARILGTKSESIVRDFYNKYHDRYDLDALVGKENGRSEEFTKIPTENLEDEASHLPEPELVVSDRCSMELGALATEVKKDPEVETLLLNGLLESAPKSPVAELESSPIVTAPLKISPIGSPRTEALSAPGESYSPKASPDSSSKEAIEQERNHFPQNVMSTKAEVVKMDDEEEPTSPCTRGQKKPPREATAKIAASSKSTATPTAVKRRRSRRSVDEVQTTPRRTRTSNSVSTTSRVRSGMQTRRSAVEKEKADQLTRSQKQKQGAEAKKGKTLTNRSRRGQSLERGEKEIGERKRKSTEVEKPAVSSRRRISLPSQALVTTESPRKRTRASTVTPSSRPSSRQRR